MNNERIQQALKDMGINLQAMKDFAATPTGKWLDEFDSSPLDVAIELDQCTPSISQLHAEAIRVSRDYVEAQGAHLPEEVTFLIDDLLTRAAIDSYARHEAMWDHIEEWDRVADSVPDAEVLQAVRHSRLIEIDAALDRMKINTPLPKAERQHLLGLLEAAV